MENNFSTERLNSLLTYYTSCIQEEEIKSLTFKIGDAEKLFYLNYFKEDYFFSLNKNQIEIEKTNREKEIFDQSLKSNNNLPLFYGYPIFVDRNGKLSPIFYVQLYYEEKQIESEGKGESLGIVLTKESVTPEFNHYILTNRGLDIEEIDKIRAEIDYERSFNEKIILLKTLLEMPDLILSPKLDDKALVRKWEPQIINKSMLYFGRRSGYTKGLLSELEILKKYHSKKLLDTSLSIITNGKSKQKIKRSYKEPLLEVFILNESQEKAVQSALVNDLTVITGPPGTGKSQVVLNIMANAIWNEQTVLFASKNNKAVNVVVDKMKSSLEENFIIRMGNDIYRKEAAQQMETLFEKRESYHLDPNYTKYPARINKITKEIVEKRKIIDRISKLNRKIEDIYKNIDVYTKLIPDPLNRVFQEDTYSFLESRDIKKDQERSEEIYSKYEKVQKKLEKIVQNNEISNDTIFLIERSDFSSTIRMEIQRDMQLLSNDAGLILKILRFLFREKYLKKDYATYKVHLDRLSNELKEYLEGITEFNRLSMEKTLKLILIYKEVLELKIQKNKLSSEESQIFDNYYLNLSEDPKEYVKKNIISVEKRNLKLLDIMNDQREILELYKKIDKISDDLLKEPSVYSLIEDIDRLKKKSNYVSRRIIDNFWYDKVMKASPEDINNIKRFIDTSKKLVDYTPPPLWVPLIKEQEETQGNIIPYLPVWVVTNLSAKRSLALKENLFDILIIDEASQCDIASALPLFYRSKRIVILGDPKQLRHISILNDYIDKNLAIKHNIEKNYVDFSYTKNSLYDLSERTLLSNFQEPLLLNEHYRSDERIISFSNDVFYGNKLKIKTDHNKLISDLEIERGIKWIDVKGKTLQGKSSYYNKEEIEETIKLLKSISESSNKKYSIGVVCIFRGHADILAERIRKTKNINKLDITVGTSHTFQGDEKDIMIFSPAVSQGIKTKTLGWIQSTSQLLNVAITRGRSSVIIIGDMEACKVAGGSLRKLVEYASVKKTSITSFDSPVEKTLYDALKNEKINSMPQYWVKVKNKRYRLDFAIFINDKKYDIEVDGDMAHKDREDYDALRDIHLRMGGWCVRRFTANDVNNNLEKVLEEIKRLC